MTDSKFKAAYQVADGYVGKARPRYFSISASDLEEDMSDEDLVNFFEEGMQDDFECNVFPEECNRNEFIEWARQQLICRENND